MQCIGAFCSVIVSNHGDLCEFCIIDDRDRSFLFEPEECIGCGENIVCGSDGYCSPCWQERFGVDEDETSYFLTLDTLLSVDVKEPIVDNMIAPELTDDSCACHFEDEAVQPSLEAKVICIAKN